MAKQTKQSQTVTNVVENVTDETVNTVVTVETTDQTEPAIEAVKTVRTSINVIDDALNCGVIDEAKHKALSGIINDGIVDITLLVNDLDKQIIKRKQDALGETYTAIESNLRAGAFGELIELCRKNKITSFNVVISDVDVDGQHSISIKRNAITGTRSTTNGEIKQRIGKFRFSNGSLTFDSVSSLVHHYEPSTVGKSMNAEALLRKLKQCTAFNVNEWTATNQNDETTETFAVWSATNYIQF